MRLCYIISGILILPIIDVALAAPVPVQEKPRARVDVVHITEDTMTMLGKRAGELDELWVELFGDAGSTSEEEPLRDLSPAHPLSSSEQSGPADGSMEVEQPLPSVPEEPSQGSNPDHAPSNPYDELNKMWLNLIGRPDSHSFAKPESSATRPSSSAQPLEPAGGPTDIEQAQPSIPMDASEVSSPGYAPPTQDEWITMWRNLIETQSPTNSEKSSPVHSSSSSEPLGPAGGLTVVERPPPSIDEEPSQVSSPDRTPQSLVDDPEWNKMWDDLFETYFPKEPEKSSAIRPSSSSQPLGPAGGPTDVEQPLPSINQEPSQVSSQENLLPTLGAYWNKKWLALAAKAQTPAESEKSSGAGPSSSSQPLGPTGGPTDVERPLSPMRIGNEVLQVFRQDYLPPKLSDKWNKMSPNPTESHFPAEPEEPIPKELWPASSPVYAPPGDELNNLWASPPSGPAHGLMDVEQPLQSIPDELLPVSSPHYAPPSPASSTNSWYDLMDWDASRGPSGPASSTMSPVDLEMMGARALPNPGLSTESDHDVL